MKKFTALAALTLTAGIFAGCAAAEDTGTNAPLKASAAPVEEKAEEVAEAPAEKVEEVEEVVVTTVTTEAPKAASSCDNVREALLTGTQADIDSAMAALQADRAADATAREYADYYLHRDADQPDLREMDVNLIRMSCSI